MNNNLQERWEKLTKKVVERKGDFDSFVEELRTRSTYFVAPASTVYHSNWKHGLLEHSIQVAETAIRIKEVLAPGISDESCVICGLFHDLGKAPLDRPYYLVNDPTPNQKRFGYLPYKPYKFNETPAVYLTVPQRALRQLTQYIPLTDDEYQAILIHDGLGAEENKPYAAKETPLALILHYADSWSSEILEGTNKLLESGKEYDTRWNTPFELRLQVDTTYHLREEGEEWYDPRRDD